MVTIYSKPLILNLKWFFSSALISRINAFAFLVLQWKQRALIENEEKKNKKIINVEQHCSRRAQTPFQFGSDLTIEAAMIRLSITFDKIAVGIEEK